MSNKDIHNLLESASASQTKKAGFVFGKEILKKPIGKTALVLALQGDLGAGKTTFLQGFALGLGIKDKITSPTFVIAKKFQIPRNKKQTNSKSPDGNFKTFFHLDCYRLQGVKDILALGFKEIIANPQNIVAIEWPENIKLVLPKNIIKISFFHKTETRRQIKI